MARHEAQALTPSTDMLLAATYWLDGRRATAWTRVEAAMGATAAVPAMAALHQALRAAHAAAPCDAGPAVAHAREALAEAARAVDAANGVRRPVVARPDEDITGQWWQQ